MIRTAGVFLPALFVSVTAASACAQQRPPEVTDSAIAWGNALFHGSANCAACHGAGGRGTEHGPNITGALWLHGPGTYESLIEQITHGVPATRSATGQAMPMRGWTPMNDEDVGREPGG